MERDRTTTEAVTGDASEIRSAAKLMDGAIGGAATILGGRHHRLELLEVDAAISVGVWNP